MNLNNFNFIKLDLFYFESSLIKVRFIYNKSGIPLKFELEKFD